MNMRDITSKLTDAFNNSRMTFEELSDKTGIPKSALHRYMTGETPKIPLDRFEIICKALDLDAAATLGWTYSWDHTIHEWPKVELPPEITIDNEEEEEETKESKPISKERPPVSDSDKAKIYQALGILAKTNKDAAVSLFEALINQGVL